MSAARALILTYHAIAAGGSPLHVEPSLFSRHVETLVAAGATTLSVSELARALQDDDVPSCAVAITFDDAFACVAEQAAPVLARHGVRATVFAVSGHLGLRNDWSTQPAGTPLLPLLGGDDLRLLAAEGWEIGSHGQTHRPLGALDPAAARDELSGSRADLERAVGAPIRSLAYPYGSVPADHARVVSEAGYATALTTRLARARPADDRLLLPRVDAHYVRDPERLRRAVQGRLEGYLAVRGVAARARRVVVPDHRVSG